MRVDAFAFSLPRECIADRPVVPRHSARLLDVDSERFSDRVVRDLADILRPGDIAVFNDTRVIPARLSGRRGEARIEVTLHRPVDDRTWDVFARPARRLRPGDRIIFHDEFFADVEARKSGGEFRLSFNVADDALSQMLRRHGAAPLPPYIQREGGPDARDVRDYQTVYARNDGSVAAPTAGLHFTHELLESLTARGVIPAFLTMHVGAGTFLPVRALDTRDHKMHSEWGRISSETATTINQARAAGGRVVAIGTTSLRLLETAASDSGNLSAFEGETDLFITPGFDFKLVDLLLTNFHLPRSTLFMLVCAFAGHERMRAAYAHATGSGYRFYSYGDCCLLRRAE